MSSETTEPVKAAATKPKSKKAAKRPKRKVRASRKLAKAKPAPRAGRPRRRKHSSDAERAKILQIALAEGLTGKEASKRFGISLPTYYAWRKKAGIKGKRGRRPSAAAVGSDAALTANVRSAVQGRIREILPELVRSEVERVVRELLGR